MRRQSRVTAPVHRPRVGIVADCTNTFGRAIFRGATRYANLQRRWLLFKDLGRLFELQHRLSGLDGGIFAGMSKSVFEYSLKQCRHAVFCSGGGDPAVSPVVSLDDVAAGAQAAQHLMDCRLERFAFYGYNADYRTSGIRLAGFRDALATRGFSCDVCPLEPPTDVQRSLHAHRPALTAWLEDLPKPVGIMAWDDTHSAEVAESCLEAGIGVPEQVAIIGVNNDDLLCESAWPPLSSVEADFTRVGYAAARVLDRLLNGEELAPGERRTLISPLGVVQRQSTSTLAIRDPNLAAAVLFIRDHACDPCSVADVLHQVPVGRRWLERQFAEKLGRTPHDEIARVRVEAAQRLLLRSDLDVPEIAVRCGFVEPKNFHVAFRKLTGTTPAAYRRQASSPAGPLRDT